MAADEPDHLLRRPLLAKELSDQRKIRLAIMAIAPGSAASGLGSALCFAGAVGAINMMAAIAGELPVERAAVSPQVIGDLLYRKPLFSEGCHNIPVRRGELLICHKANSLLGGSEKAGVLQVTSSFEHLVALSI